MIRALVTGVLHCTPERRIGKTGKPFTTGKLRADGKDGSTIWCSLLAFDEQADALAEQKANAAISVSGRATPTAWLSKAGEPQAGLDVVVDQLAALRTKPKPRTSPAPTMTPAGFDDALPEF